MIRYLHFKSRLKPGGHHISLKKGKREIKLGNDFFEATPPKVIPIPLDEDRIPFND